jgi:hypothetical protein
LTTIDMTGKPVSDIIATFHRWFSAHRGTLTIPLVQKAKAPGSISLAFVGLADAIEVIVHSGGIRVSVEHEDECWDLLTDIECSPEALLSSGRAGTCQAAVTADRPGFNRAAANPEVTDVNPFFPSVPVAAKQRNRRAGGGRAGGP